MSVFKSVHPVIPVRNVKSAIDYYTNKLGFKLRFSDAGDNPGYAGVGRDDVEIHLQWHDESSFELVEKLLLRLFVSDVDSLFAEYSDKDVFHEGTALRNTAWGTREFAFYDPDKNGLIFYRDL